MTTTEDREPATPSAAEAVTIGVPLRTLAVRVFACCLAAELVLVLLDYVITFEKVIGEEDLYRGIHRIFNIAREESLPTWFASTQAVFVGLTLLATACVVGRQGASRLTRWGWCLFGAFFIFLGIDDAAVIHERVGSFLGNLAEARGEQDAVQSMLDLTFSWQVFVAPVYALVGISLFVFLWKHLGRFRLQPFMVTGLACFAVAMGIDFIEGIDGYYDSLAADWGLEDYTVSHYGKVLEEFLEMLGTSLLWLGFLLHLAAVSDGVTVRPSNT